MTSRRAARAVPVLVCTAVLLSGCSTFTAKKEQAERLVNAPRELGERGSFTGALTVTARLTKADGLGASARAEAKAEEKRSAAVRVDLDEDLAAYVPAGAKTIHRVFSGLRLYGKRPDARPDDARPWVRISASRIEDPQALDPQQTSPVSGIDVLPPALLVDLVAGSLAGSVKNLGAETVDGVATTRYAANVDVVKALRKATRRSFNDKQRRDVVDLLAAMGCQEEALHKASVWVDDSGVPRRIALTLREEPSKDVVYSVEFDLRITSLGAPVTITRPSLEEEVVVGSVSQYLTAVSPPKAVAPTPSASPAPRTG